MFSSNFYISGLVFFLKGFNLLEGNFHFLALSTLPLPQLDSIFCIQKIIFSSMQTN